MDEAPATQPSAVPEVLRVHHWPVTPERLARIKEAKATLTDAPLVVPRAAEPGCGMILAFEHPPWVAEYCLVSDETSTENMADAIAAVLGMRYDSRTITLAKSLSRMLGGVEVREV